jgi:hypothetical protein
MRNAEPDLVISDDLLGPRLYHWRAVCCESGKHGSGRGRQKSTCMVTRWRPTLPMVDPKRGVGVVLATNCTSMLMQRAEREVKQK